MEATRRAAATTRLRQLLHARVNLTGGWPYTPGKVSRIEPTCWALLALRESDAADPVAADAKHLALLRSRQRDDGLLVDYPQAPVNFTSNGTAAALGRQLFRADAGFVDGVVSGLNQVKGVSVALDDPRQNNRLQAWPWMADTFSWVEPTAWCVLALKRIAAGRRSPEAAARLGEAEALLKNRSCDGGGWNYGNASALGQDLRPHVPTTALALLALQDHRDDPVVAASITYLERAELAEASSLALGLTALALRVFDRSVEQVETRLAGLSPPPVENLHASAIALYALSADTHNVEALRVVA